MDERPADTLGEDIGRLRSKAGYTLRKFATDYLGISAAHLSDIEHNRRRPSKELLEKIAASLKHVGATYESLDRLNSRLEPEIQRWVYDEPAARQLLRKVKESGQDPRDVLRKLEQVLKEKDRGR